MTITLYGLKNCDTCKKARSAIEQAGMSVTFVDIRQDADLEAKVPGWVDVLGCDALVNKRSTTWRSLDEVTRTAASEQDRCARVLIDHPTLIKRPVVERGETLIVGWREDSIDILNGSNS